MYFSDYFKVSPLEIEKYGALNISLDLDLPLFIDPFLLFNSKNRDYQELHENILNYLIFLREKARSDSLDIGFVHYYYVFNEVKQNWLGYTVLGNQGLGLGKDFANILYNNLNSIFTNFGKEKVTKSSHLEKLYLVTKGVGRDRISDFTTNLIKEYLLKYTQVFANQHISKKHLKQFTVGKVRFNYVTESWESDTYVLPYYENDYVMLTPRNINKNGYKIFYHNGAPLKSEHDVRDVFRFVWFNTTSDISRESDEGRGRADYKISKGSKDKTIIEIKLARNSQLKKNLINQADIYLKSHDAQGKIIMIVYFNDREYDKVIKILAELKMSHDKNIILIDATKKISASKA